MAAPALSAPERGARTLIAVAALVALWLGAAAFFALTVAPSAFAALPSRELAGAVVGRVLPVLFWSGAAVGALLVLLEARGPRAGHWRVRMVASSSIAVACLIAQLAIAPRIASLRSEMREPLASLAPTDPQRVAFGRLHMFSVAWLGVAMLGGFTVLATAAVTLDRINRR